MPAPAKDADLQDPCQQAPAQPHEEGDEMNFAAGREGNKS